MSYSAYDCMMHKTDEKEESYTCEQCTDEAFKLKRTLHNLIETKTLSLSSWFVIDGKRYCVTLSVDGPLD